MTERDARRERRATVVAAAAFILATLAALGLIVVYVRGGQTQLEGVLLALAFGGVGVGVGVWARVLLDEPSIVEERAPMASTAAARARLEDAIEPDEPGRRRVLARLLAGAGGTIGIALLLPLRSLGPGPQRELYRTSWREGVRLVREDGEPLRVGDLRRGEMVTVFPEGATHAADSAAVLIGVTADHVQPPGAPETVPGHLCYSKICTHAGCAVGLYRAEEAELLCPCHQSTFDVLDRATPVSGPAARRLPQLPIAVDDDGFLVALGDFPEPVGPSFWNMRR